MIPISRLLVTAGNDGDLVAFGREGARSRADLRQDVATLAARLTGASALECLVEDGDTLTATGCAIVLPDGRNCVVDGAITREAAGDGNRYHGSASLSGAGCPASTVAVDVTLVG